MTYLDKAHGVENQLKRIVSIFPHILPGPGKVWMQSFSIDKMRRLFPPPTNTSSGGGGDDGGGGGD